MPIDHLNHINLRARDIHETRDFYRDVLGLEEGHRPPFPSPGYWMYDAGGRPVVHISHSEDDSASRTNPEGMGRGLDHFALWASGLKEQLEILESRGIEYHRQEQTGVGMIQIFFQDPNGVIIELGYDPVAEGLKKEGAEPATV